MNVSMKMFEMSKMDGGDTDNQSNKQQMDHTNRK